MIYLIKLEKYFKIGYSANESSLKRRLWMYNIHLPEFYGFADVKVGTKEDETFYHHLFEKWRVRIRSEWFFLNEESLSILEKYFDYTNPMIVNTKNNDSISSYLKRFYQENPDKRESISRKLGGKPFYMYRENTLLGKFLSIPEAAKFISASQGAIQKLLYSGRTGKYKHLKGIRCEYIS